ncbi:MAG: hypothetical protein IJA12_02240 [Oscillospiraceae bacterium]|nr:hypothetical protein [Oscillospiraceae bacterium]
MKHLRKNFSIISIIMTGVILFGTFSFTGCSFLNFGNNPNKFSITQLENLEDTVDTVVKDYFNDKYGVEAVVTYKSIAGGVFLGPDPSSVQYYLVAVNIADGNIENKYYVDVHGRETDGIDELYVKRESYYGQVIKERMEEWLDRYMNNTYIDEYYILYKSVVTNYFPSEYEVNASVEEIIQSVSSIEDNKERPYLPLFIFIPESEYEKHNNMESEFDAIRNSLAKLNSGIKIIAYVCSDEEYERNKIDDDYRISPILEFEITGKE